MRDFGLTVTSDSGMAVPRGPGALLASLARSARVLASAFALGCAFSLAAVGGAQAVVLYTYTFTQDGYTSTGSLTGVLSGSFISSVAPGGQINESDLSSIDVTFDFGLGKSFGSATSLFSYDPSLGARELELIIDGTSGAPGNFPICVGGVAQISFGGCSPGGPGVEGSFNLSPGVQFYTANHIQGEVPGKAGAVYHARGAYCFETQHFPDSPNQPSFPTTVLKPGETYHQTTIFRFSTT